MTSNIGKDIDNHNEIGVIQKTQIQKIISFCASHCKYHTHLPILIIFNNINSFLAYRKSI